MLWLKFRSCYRSKGAEWICKQDLLTAPKLGLLLAALGSSLGEEVEGVAGTLGRAAPAVTLSCGKGTRAGKQKDHHQKLCFCSAENICFPPMRKQKQLGAAARSSALCASSAGVSSALLSDTTLWTYFWELCSVINIPLLFNLRGESSLLTSSDLFESLSGQ